VSANPLCAWRMAMEKQKAGGVKASGWFENEYEND